MAALLTLAGIVYGTTIALMLLGMAERAIVEEKR